jgi:multiple sugar transport system ATP-binding protein
VAAFIGSPSMNFVRGSVGGGQARFGGVTAPLPAGSPLAGAERDLIIGVRPTAFAPGDHAGWTPLTITPAVVEELGDERNVIFDLDGPRVDTEATRAALDARSSDDVLLLPAEERARFTAKLPADMPMPLGEPLTVSFDPARLYFFDPETGLALG